MVSGVLVSTIQGAVVRKPDARCLCAAPSFPMLDNLCSSLPSVHFVAGLLRKQVCGEGQVVEGDCVVPLRSAFSAGSTTVGLIFPNPHTLPCISLLRAQVCMRRAPGRGG